MTPEQHARWKKENDQLREQIKEFTERYEKLWEAHTEALLQIQQYRERMK